MFQENTVSHSLIGVMRGSSWTMRGIASVVILTFGSLVTAPAVAAVKQEIEEIQWHKQEEGPGANLSARLQAVRDHLAMAGKKSLKSGSLADERKELKGDADALADLDKDTLDSFASVSKMIKDKHLPEVIQQRELAAEKQYKTEMAALRQGLDAVAQEKDDTKAQAKTKEVLDRLSKFQMERGAQKFDPKNMPNRSLKPDLTRVPHTTKKSFAEAGFTSNPRLMVATTASSFDYSQLPGASDPAYLAATTEVTLSPAIQAQAAALHNNPVEIYNWVRNNVQWQPTWGAVQDADLTLSAQRGNAFDISSLLIALLRASGIPARYVHGTINVPEAKFRNWVGGFQNINAAVNYASAGGIPVKSLISGGKVVTVQMEHIWVEAAIDYIPSRGVVNKSADTWMPMDASYKQYTLQKGIDAASASGVNVSAVYQQYLATGTINSSQGWASGLNPAPVQNAVQNAETAVQGYLSQNMPNAGPLSVIGGYSIVPVSSTALAATLPYGVVVSGSRYAALPGSLQQTITFSLGVDSGGSPANPVTLPWAQVNNHQITLSYQPATSADVQTILSLYPSAQTSDFSRFPTSIPAYLVNVIPQLKLDGQVISTGSVGTLGSDMVFGFTPNFAGRQSVPNSYDVTAGSFLDIGAIAGNIDLPTLAALQENLQLTSAALQSNDPTEMASLTQKNLLGDLFQMGLLSYYAQYSAFAFVAGLSQGGHQYLAAGIGSFGYEPQVDYTFGVPSDIHGGGMIFNLPIVNVFGYDGTDSTARINYVLQVGSMSSELESAVPGQIFSTSTQAANGISAVTALSDAMQSGQRLLDITQTNESALLPTLNLSSSVTEEITNALAAGKEVIAHTDNISAAGWTGAGYIIFDPQTGDGAYQISGGENGGSLPLAQIGTIAVGVLAAALAVIALFAAPIGVLLALADFSWVYTTGAAVAGIGASFYAKRLGFPATFLDGAQFVMATLIVFALFATGAGEALTIGFALTQFLVWMWAFATLIGSVLLDLYEEQAEGQIP